MINLLNHDSSLNFRAVKTQSAPIENNVPYNNMSNPQIVKNADGTQKVVYYLPEKYNYGVDTIELKDNKGKVTKETIYGAEGKPLSTLEYKYHQTGELAEKVRYDGKDSMIRCKDNFAPNGVRLSEIIYEKGKIRDILVHCSPFEDLSEMKRLKGLKKLIAKIKLSK